MLLVVRHVFFAHQRQNVFVENLALAIRQLLEARESRIDLCLTVHLHTKLLQTLFERIAAAELAQHNLVSRPAHIFCAHDFIGIPRLEHTVLVNTGGVCKCIRTNHGLVRLYDKTGSLAHHATGCEDMARINAHLQTEIVLAGFHRHDDFFEAAIASTLAQTVDSALYLPCATDLHTCQRIGNRHTQVVVAMNRPDSLVRVGDALTQGLDEVAIEFWHGIAHGVRHIDGCCTFGDDSFKHTAEKVHIAAIAIFRTELDVAHQIARKPNGLFGLLKYLVWRHAQLLLHVQRGSRNKRMDTCAIRTLESFRCPGDITVIGP